MLFAYGTLQDTDVLAAVLGRPIAATALTDATLAGFATVHYPERTYPALRPAAHSFAPGKIIDRLDARDVALIDAFEGEAYRRSLLTVRINDAPQQAFAYLPTSPIAASEAPWSLAAWTSQHKSAFMREEFGIVL